MSSETTPLTNFASAVLTKENAQAAGSFAQLKFKELTTQVSNGDVSMRLLALLGGVMLLMLSATEFLGKLMYLNIFGALLDIYTFLLAIIVLILEGNKQIPFFPNNLAVTVHKYAHILKYVWGRGALYFVAGTLQCEQMGLLDLIVGGFMALVGVIYIAVGKKAMDKLKELKNSSVPESTLIARFKEADYNRKGKLDIEGFKYLERSLGLAFNQREIEASFLSIDKDSDGLISFEEFQEWWNALDDPGFFHLV